MKCCTTSGSGTDKQTAPQQNQYPKTSGLRWFEVCQHHIPRFVTTSPIRTGGRHTCIDFGKFMLFLPHSTRWPEAMGRRLHETPIPRSCSDNSSHSKVPRRAHGDDASDDEDSNTESSDGAFGLESIPAPASTSFAASSTRAGTNELVTSTKSQQPCCAINPNSPTSTSSASGHGPGDSSDGLGTATGALVGGIIGAGVAVLIIGECYHETMHSCSDQGWEQIARIAARLPRNDPLNAPKNT
ncbi:hypothetical protein F4824DRAFT_470875 [Ustulina deusta]|nr:hypothetical protein F4824DRAFT_470875 [Ustulina deusta]